MKLNIFEGARRITKIIAVMWVIGWSYYLMTYEPYEIIEYFRIDSFAIARSPLRTETKCNTDDAISELGRNTDKGTTVRTVFCFTPQDDPKDSSKKFIPIGVDTTNLDKITDANKNGRVDPWEMDWSQDKFNKTNYKGLKWFGYEKNHADVSIYTNNLIRKYNLSEADEEWADDQVWPARWKEIKESSSSIIGGLAFLFIFSWCIGWIVRGFAGIPSGQDKKLDDI